MKPAAPPKSARFLRVNGVVQGVGFRPFVHRLAQRLGLSGWVRNVAGTVEIHLEGPEAQVDAFERSLRADAPPVSRIDGLQSTSVVAGGVDGFSIIQSADADGVRPVPPDVGTCASCEAELFDNTDLRFRHPFITCTDCGPRYTIIDELPYDRERTSMKAFVPCPRCATEYATPTDRRFHAETIACHACGPRVWLEDTAGYERGVGETAILLAATALRVGAIVALRGLGGFHLAVDATNDAAVRRLR
ncbi:MAG TPA: acylphosphatase, partial [Gemmatimonadaceae bacterium]